MQGKYSGYEVTFRDGDKLIKLDVTHGVRGLNIPVEVKREEHGYSVSFQGKKLKVTSIWENTWKRVN